MRQLGTVRVSVSQYDANGPTPDVSGDGGFSPAVRPTPCRGSDYGAEGCARLAHPRLPRIFRP